MRLKLFFLSLIFLSQAVVAQQSDGTENLLKELSQYTSATQGKADLLLKIASAYYGKNPDKMLQYADDALQTSLQAKYKNGEAGALRFKGIGAYMKGDFKSAEQYFSEALRIQQESKNAKGIIACLSNLGSVNMVQNNFPKALQFYQQALKTSIAEKDDLNSGITYGNMGVIFSELKDYDKALEHFRGGMEMHKKIDYKIGVANGLGNIGNVYFKQKKFQEAKTYYQLALNENIELGNKLATAREYGNLGNAYLELNEPDKATDAYQKALQMNTEIGNKKGLAVINQGLANYYLVAKNWGQSVDYAQNALKIANDINLGDVKAETYKILSTAYQNQNKYAEALEAYKKYIGEQNSIDNDNNRKQILRLETQYEFDTKEEKYKNEQLLAQTRITQQDLELKNNKLQLSEAEKQKQIENLNFLKSQAELEKQQFISENNQKKLKLSEQEKEVQKAKNTELQNEKQLQALQLKNFWLYAGISILALIGLASLIISRLRIKNLKAKNELQKQKAQQQQEELVLKNEIKEAEMQSLRSQMNPHFMFNSINSINNFILKNEKETASKYLTTFARLMRSILDNSQQTEITLNKELETLKWYMELEAARLEHSFDYKINIAPNVDTENTYIPPLVLQPFVENAIWHGLNHRKDKGFIEIDIFFAENEDLIIKIIDNGIGRKAAEKYSKPENRKSYGIATTINRIKMLNPDNKVEIVDLYNDGIATGTEIKFLLKNY